MQYCPILQFDCSFVSNKFRCCFSLLFNFIKTTTGSKSTFQPPCYNGQQDYIVWVSTTKHMHLFFHNLTHNIETER